jgi:hypothetical protein
VNRRCCERKGENHWGKVATKNGIEDERAPESERWMVVATAGVAVDMCVVLAAADEYHLGHDAYGHANGLLRLARV